MGEIFGAVGSIASASIQAGAIKDATQMQIDALNKQRQFVYDQLDPSKIGGAASAQDVQNAQNRLALQALTDPTLLAQRYKSESQISDLASKLGEQSGAVGSVAAKEAVAGVPGMQDAKKQLVDAALKELSEGATLPPDVQAELVKAGLEKSGMVTGAASPKGVGGQLLRTILGSAGIQLQQQRQTQAAGLLGQAQQLEQSRQQILGTLFPNLATTQLNTLSGAQNVLNQSNSMMAPAGLSGTDIANLWLARVGATTQLSQAAAQAAGQGALGQAQAWNQGFGSAINYGANALPSTASLFKTAATSSPTADASDFEGAVY